MGVADTIAEEPRSTAFSWQFSMLIAVLVAASLAPIWITQHFPSQNGPWYLLQVHMLKEYQNPEWDYADYYRIVWHPKPHMLHNMLVLALSYFVPLLTAEKLALSVYVVLLPASIFYFLSVCAPDRRILGLMSFLMIHCYELYRGYNNFTLSLPLFFLTLAFWFRYRDRLGLKHAITLALLSTVTCLAHFFTFLFLSCSIAYYSLLETRSVRKAAVRTLFSTWAGWILFVEYFIWMGGNATETDLHDTSFLPLHTAVEYSVRQFFYSISGPAYFLAVLPWLLIVYLLSKRFLRLIRSDEFWKGFFREPLLVLLVTVILCYFLVPYKFHGWHYVNIRTIPFILGFALACAELSPAFARPGFFRAGFVLSVSAIALSVDCLLCCKVVEMQRDLDEYLSGVAAYERNLPMLPVHAENKRFGQVRPVTRAHEYYHITKGGANGSSFARFRHLATVQYLTYPHTAMFPQFDPASPDGSMRRIKDTYGYVLVWGKDEAWDSRLAAFGFTMVHHQGRMRLYRSQVGNANSRDILVGGEDGCLSDPG